MGAGRTALRVLLAAIALAALGPAPQAAPLEDLTTLPFEQLLGSEVTDAAQFARRITDAASAVSVVTAQDIRDHGVRTLSEALDLMRGLHMTYVGYAFLGERGFGGRAGFAGRVMLFIDGIPAVDNLYDQVFLTHDALIDVALIDRIEYAPGSGSALYGNNAYLGVINIVTKRGRDLDGLQAQVSGASWRDQGTRASWGRRLGDEAEVLLSATRQRDNGIAVADAGRNVTDPAVGAQSEQFFVKARWGRLDVQGMLAQRYVLDRRDASSHDDHMDRNQVLSLNHDVPLNDEWTLGTRLTLGQYGFRSNSETETDSFAVRQDGVWWQLDQRLAFSGQRHRLALGFQARRDPVLRDLDTFVSKEDGSTSTGSWYEHRRAVGVSIEDEFRWRPQWRVTVGARWDHRSASPSAVSPRLALVWAPPEGPWSAKLSQGRATRFASATERMFADGESRPLEHVTTQELVGEYRRDGLRALTSLYRYRTTQLISDAFAYGAVRAEGIETELEWQWEGWRVRASHAWQHARATSGLPMVQSPDRVGKLQVSAPLGSERWRLSLSARTTGTLSMPAEDDSLIRMPATAVLDLTLVARSLMPGVDVRWGVRNATGSRTQAMRQFDAQPGGASMARQWWCDLVWSLR